MRRDPEAFSAELKKLGRSADMGKKTVFLIVTEHFDLVWRRCFQRDLSFRGETFVPYADLEAYDILDNLALCEKYDFYRFEIESVHVLREFLHSHPEQKDVIARLIREKRIYIPFSGDNIVDSNLISGESIIRNYLIGQEYLKREFDDVPSGMDRNDAFGNSAQIPQIARKFGSRWVYHITYSPCSGEYWRGLDGSTVYCFQPKQAGYTGGYYKYRPCPACRGDRSVPCDVCGGRRIDEAFMEKLRVPVRFHPETADQGEMPGYIYIGGEEILPSEDIIRWAQEHRDQYDFRFATFEDYIPYFQEKLDAVDRADLADVHGSAEINANNTGCYVTRIRVKQELRRNEHDLLALESLAVMSALRGRPYPYEKLEEIWVDMLFAMFHDAVTATHVDAAYREIIDCLEKARREISDTAESLLSALYSPQEGMVTVWNPTGCMLSAQASVELSAAEEVRLADACGTEAVVIHCEQREKRVRITFAVTNIPAFSFRTYRVIPTGRNWPETLAGKTERLFPPGSAILTNQTSGPAKENRRRTETIENDFYALQADECGIKSIFDKKLNRTIACESTYRVGEWILEHDEGSPWATLSDDMRRQKLSEYTNLIGCSRTADGQTLQYRIVPGAIDGYSVTGLVIIFSVTLRRNDDMVRFSADVNWDTQNYRLRIAFPVPASGRYFYDIPYGVIERKPYKPDCVLPNGASNWAAAAGDYPALNWAGVQADGFSIALFNQGTPSCQIAPDDRGNDTMYLSVLRSPSIGTYLHSPAEYVMTDYDGMRDSGTHHFEYALKSYGRPFCENGAVPDGIGYNTRLCAVPGRMQTVPFPTVESSDAYLAAIKMAQDGGGLVLRIAEYHGRDSVFSLRIPDQLKISGVYETDLMEENRRLISETSDIPIGHFEIKTIYLSRSL